MNRIDNFLIIFVLLTYINILESTNNNNCDISIKYYGERNTGTNWLDNLIVHNFKEWIKFQKYAKRNL